MSHHEAYSLDRATLKDVNTAAEIAARTHNFFNRPASVGGKRCKRACLDRSVAEFSQISCQIISVEQQYP